MARRGTDRQKLPSKKTGPPAFWSLEVEFHPDDEGPRPPEYHGADRIEMDGSAIVLFSEGRVVTFERSTIRKVLVMRTKKESLPLE